MESIVTCEVSQFVAEAGWYKCLYLSWETSILLKTLSLESPDSKVPWVFIYIFYKHTGNKLLTAISMAIISFNILSPDK